MIEFDCRCDGCKARMEIDADDCYCEDCYKSMRTELESAGAEIISLKSELQAAYDVFEKSEAEIETLKMRLIEKGEVV